MFLVSDSAPLCCGEDTEWPETSNRCKEGVRVLPRTVSESVAEESERDEQCYWVYSQSAQWPPHCSQIKVWLYGIGKWWSIVLQAMLAENQSHSDVHWTCSVEPCQYGGLCQKTGSSECWIQTCTYFRTQLHIGYHFVRHLVMILTSWSVPLLKTWRAFSTTCICSWRRS